MRKALLVIGISLMAVGQLQVFRAPPIEWLNGGYLLLLVGLGCFFTACRGLTFYPESSPFIPVSHLPFRFNRRWLALCLGLSCFITLRSILSPPLAYLGEYLFVWGLTILALLLAVRSPDVNAQGIAPIGLTRRDYGLLAALFVTGFLIRGTNLERIPAFLDQDEAIFAQQGAYSRVADHFLVNPFAPGFHSYALLHSSLISLSTGVFGQTLVGARLPSAILGTLGILALYLLGRELYNWQVGLIAALFALTWPFQVIFSRLALNQPGDPLFMTLAFYFLLRGIRRASPMDYTLSGIMLGLAQFFYLGGRLGLVVMFVYLIFLFIKQRTLLINQWRLVALVPFATFVVTLPQNFYQFYFQLPLTVHTDPSIFSGMLQKAIESGPTVLREYLTKQMTDALGGLFALSDQGGWFGAGSNLMGPFGGALLCVGFFISFREVRKNTQGILAALWAAAVTFFGVVLTTYSPHYQRYFPGVSALALLVGIGTMAILNAAFQLFQPPIKSSHAAIGLATILFLANAVFFYGLYVPAGNYIDNRANHITNRIAQDMLAAFDTDKQIFLLASIKTPVENTNVVKYFMMGKPYTMVYEGKLNSTLQAFDRNKPYLFIVAPERVGEIDDLMRLFPEGNPAYVIVPGEDSAAYYKYEH